MEHFRPTPLRVLQIVPHLNEGGAETTTLQITRALVAAGGKAIVATEGGAMAAQIEAAGGEIAYLPVASKNPITMLANIKRLERLCTRRSIDIIHARSRASAWSALAVAKTTGKPYLATYHSRVHKQPPIKVFYNSVMTRGRVVIANSRFTAECIHQTHRIPFNRIRVVPRGCDPVFFNPPAQDHKDVIGLRQSWGASDQQRLLICPARLTRWKGHTTLLQALSRLPDPPPVVLIGDTVGRETYRAELLTLAATLGLSDRIVFAGHLSNMPLAYAAADLAVLPSIAPEPFGRTVIEAQAARVPVIVSDHGGFRETVLDANEAGGPTGWRVPPDDADALADTLAIALSADDSKLMEIGNQGRQHILQHFSAHSMCAKTLAIYREVSGCGY